VLEAHDQSVRATGFAEDHTNILQSSEAIDRLNALLARNTMPPKTTGMSR